MALPVLETFAEHGYNLFHTPEDVYADFCASGIFRRLGIDVSNEKTSRLYQREALFDVALTNGLSSIIAIYILAQDTKEKFLLQEPVAVQTWVKSSFERIQSSIQDDHDDSNTLHPNLRHLRGLKQVVDALLERFEKGKQAALPTQPFLLDNDSTPWTTNALAYLSTLVEEIGSWESFVLFKIWLYDTFESCSLAVSTNSKIFQAILHSADLSHLLPLPSMLLDVFQHLNSIDTLTRGAILVFLSLDHCTSSNFNELYETALDCADALDLPHMHASHVMSLWCLDHAQYVSEACDLLMESPQDIMDKEILLTVLELLMRMNHPALAYRIYTSFPISMVDEDDDPALLLTILSIVLELNQSSLAWIVAREYPNHSAKTFPILIQYHRDQGTIRDILVQMSWSENEVKYWLERLNGEERRMLHLIRSEFQQARNETESNSADINLLLGTVPATSMGFSIPPMYPTSELNVPDHSMTSDESTPPNTTCTWPKPSIDQYESVLHKTKPCTNSVSNSNLSLQLKKHQTTPNSPKLRKEMTCLNETNGILTTTTLPYQWLSTELTPGPHSASKITRIQPFNVDEPLELRPIIENSDVFLTPTRENVPKIPQTVPARRNPIRDVRKKY